MFPIICLKYVSFRKVGGLEKCCLDLKKYIYKRNILVFIEYPSKIFTYESSEAIRRLTIIPSSRFNFSNCSFVNPFPIIIRSSNFIKSIFGDKIVFQLNLKPICICVYILYRDFKKSVNKLFKRKINKKCKQTYTYWNPCSKG